MPPPHGYEKYPTYVAVFASPAAFFHRPDWQERQRSSTQWNHEGKVAPFVVALYVLPVGTMAETETGSPFVAP